MKTKHLVFAFAVGAFAALPLHAGLSDLSKAATDMMGSQGTAASEDLLTKGNALYAKLASARKDIATGYAYATDALGLKDQSEKIKSVIASSGKQTVDEQLKSLREIATETNKKLKDAWKNKQNMSAEQKQALINSVTSLNKGLDSLKGISGEATSLAANAAQSISQAAMTDKAGMTAKLKGLSSLPSSISDDLNTTSQVIQSLTQLASANGVKLK